VVGTGSGLKVTWMRTVRAPAAKRFWQPLTGAPGWQRVLAFLFGFFVQCNMLVGGNGEGAVAAGGFGFRVFDCLSVAAVALLLIHVLQPHRLIALVAFTAIIGTLTLLRLEEPTFWYDPRTVTLGLHYLAYCFAGLYLAIICSEEANVTALSWGLILGLLATTPIFVLQGMGYSADLVRLGLVPGYYDVLELAMGDVPRYSGLWGHPNEAGHVAALSSAAGAYFAFCYRRYIPAVLTAVALVVVFYYTQSRGGLIAGASVLVISFLFPRGQKLDFLRLAISGFVILLAIGLFLQLSFVSYRFEDDPTTASNFSERFGSTLAGIQIAIGHPFGMSLDSYAATIDSYTGGVGSPHNGFVTFVIVFGIVPLVALIAAFAMNLRVRNNTDAFFFLLVIQISVSFMFEQLPADYDYAFFLCVILSRAFVRTRIGAILTSKAATRRPLARLAGRSALPSA
jgi:O-Antigen ligase